MKQQPFFGVIRIKRCREKTAVAEMNRLAAQKETKPNLKEETIMRLKEELNALKEKAETENRQCRLLTDEKVEQVAGGIGEGALYPYTCCPVCGNDHLSWFNIVYAKEYGKYRGTAYCRHCDWAWTGPLLR